jgi:hypothetical protein
VWFGVSGRRKSDGVVDDVDDLVRGSYKVKWGV